MRVWGGGGIFQLLIRCEFYQASTHSVLTNWLYESYTVPSTYMLRCSYLFLSSLSMCRPWTRDILEVAHRHLSEEIAIPDDAPGGKSHFRRTLIHGPFLQVLPESFSGFSAGNTFTVELNFFSTII